MKKQRELKGFLVMKYREVLEMKEEQDLGLKRTLEEIKEGHLGRLLGKSDKGDTSRNEFLSHHHHHTS